MWQRARLRPATAARRVERARAFPYCTIQNSPRPPYNYGLSRAFAQIGCTTFVTGTGVEVRCIAICQQLARAYDGLYK